jgi:hypothetical protein
MVLVIFLNDVGCRLLLVCKNAMMTIINESSWPKVDHNTMQTTRTLSTRSTYSAIARLTIGRHGPTLVEVSIVVTLWGACAVYMITISQLLNEVAPVISRAQYTLATGLLLLPFSFASDLSFLSWVSTVCSRTRR